MSNCNHSWVSNVRFDSAVVSCSICGEEANGGYIAHLQSELTAARDEAERWKMISHDQAETIGDLQEDVHCFKSEAERLRRQISELAAREDAMCDLHYANGAKAGFSLGQTDDDDGLEKIVATRYSGGVKELKHLRTKADELEVGGDQ